MSEANMPKPKTKISVTLSYDQWTLLLRGLRRLEQLKPEAGENAACFAMEISSVKQSQGMLTEALAQKIANRRGRR